MCFIFCSRSFEASSRVRAVKTEVSFGTRSVLFRCRELKLQAVLWLKKIVVTLAGAGTAQRPAAYHDFALEIYAFAAFGTDHAQTFETRQVFGLHVDPHPLLVKEHFIRERRAGLL